MVNGGAEDGEAVAVGLSPLTASKDGAISRQNLFKCSERAESETRETATQIKALLGTQKEVLLNKIEEARDTAWAERGVERESESKMQQFRDEKADHHVNVTRQRIESLEKALREERADRIRYVPPTLSNIHVYSPSIYLTLHLTCVP